MAVLFSTNGNLLQGGAVLEASDGTKIAVYVFNGTGNVYIRKNLDTTPVTVDDNTATVVHGGGNIAWVHAAIDSDDLIHVLCACDSEQTRDVAYSTCTLTGTFATWTQAADYSQQAPVYPGCAISIDGNDYPHILFVDNVKMQGSAQDNVYYDYNDGSWNGAEQVGARNTKTDFYRYPRISHAPNDDIEAFYYFAIVGDTAYRRRNGTWNTESVYSEASAAPLGVTVTTGDAVYRYHFRASVMEENDVSTGYGCRSWLEGGGGSPSLVGTDRYLVYVESGSNDVRVISNTGSGWTDEGVQHEGTFTRLISGWAYNNFQGNLNYIFTDGNNIWWDSFSLSGLTQVYKDLQAKWDMRELVNKDTQIKWDIFDLVYKDIQLKWDILLEVYNNIQLKWDMRELVYKDLQAKWDIRELVYKDLQVVWDILDTVGNNLQAKWDILGLVYKDIQIKWDILNLAGKSIQLVWDMSGSVGRSLQAVWDIFAEVNKDLQAKWDINVLVYKDVQVKWDIREFVNNSIQLVWDIRELVYKDIQLVWDILSSISQVYKDLQVKWDIDILVNKDIQIKWDILNLVNKSIEAVWDIRELVGKSLQVKWDIANLVFKDLQAKWDIDIIVNKSTEIKYDILNLVNKSIEAVWDMAMFVNKSIQLVWDIGDISDLGKAFWQGLRRTSYRVIGRRIS